MWVIPGEKDSAMQHRQHHIELSGLMPQAFVATLAVVVLPVALVLALVALGLPDPQVVLATGLGLVLSCVAAAVGTSLWIKRPESVDVGFGELMLWRYLRRKKAEETIETGVKTLGLVPDLPGTAFEPESRLAVLQDLADALEDKDPYTHGHSNRVERHAYRIAMAMHLPADDIEDLRLAASLHDVGKIQVPSRVLRKPGKLDEHEFALVRRHAEVGAALVEQSADPRVTMAIRHHHEAWNGMGYPGKLQGEEIPLFARIIAVADAFDAMTSARPYKAGCSRKEAIDKLCAGAGIQFDRTVVEAFISTLPTALPAAGALLIFAGPARAARNLVARVKDLTGGGLAGAASAAGMAALIGTAGIGGLQTRPATPPMQMAAPAQAAASASVLGERVTANGEPNAEDSTDGNSDGTATREQGDGENKSGVQARKPKSGGSSAPASSGDNRAGDGTNDGGSDAGTNSGGGAGGGNGGGTSEPAPEPKPDPEPKPEPDPAAPGDPQPDKGKDCSNKNNKNGKGSEKHCGE